jgi:magnesium-dependent phosphatase-1
MEGNGSSMAIRLVIFDADKTLWTHSDISRLVLPFRLVSRDVITDANGESFQLFDGVRELLEGLESKRVLITMAS